MRTRLYGASSYLFCILRIIACSSFLLEWKAKTPAGEVANVRPRRSECDEEAHGSPAESEAFHGNKKRYYELLTK
jgi:hypothetical protein